MKMDHFDIVLTLSRLALGTEEARARQQVERLRDALAKTDIDQAEKLGRLLNRSSRRHVMSPLAMEEMRSMADSARRQLQWEALSPSTPIPTDRETGTPLARIAFPDNSDKKPILNEILSEAIKDLLAEWQHGDDLARIGAKPHMRCLIYGPPGVGKTKLARYLAQQLGLPCVEARLDGLVSSFLGTTARNIGALFDFANRYRCVLFLDEFDAVAKARDDSQEMGEIKRVVNSLLQSIDARNGLGITLAATNHEHLLDSAVWRRFDARIELDKPNVDAREHLLKTFLRPMSIKPSELQLLIWATEGMSGADIEMLVDAGKRFFVLHGGTNAVSASALETSRSSKPSTVLEGLRRQVALNIRLFTSERASLLVGPIEGLNEALEQAGMTQENRGMLLGLSQSAVSRLGKRNESSEAFRENLNA